MYLSEKLEIAAKTTREVAGRKEGEHRANLLHCAEAFEGAAQDARDLERDAAVAPPKKSPRFRGHHLRRRFRERCS